MSTRIVVGGIVATILLIAPGSCFAQQERHNEKSTKLPDSLASSLSAKPDESRIQSNWGKLKKGLTFKEVESLLGKPTKIAESIYDHSTAWYYRTRVIVFDNIKHAVRYWREKE